MKCIFIGLTFNLSILLSNAQDPFESYVNNDAAWYPSIFQLYIQQYCGLHVNKYMIDATDLTSIEDLLEPNSSQKTTDINEAVNSVAEGKKVFFFIDNSVWGTVDAGTLYSGSWQKQMPLCSGFYISKKRCFQKEGLNFHIKVEDNHLLVFYIMK